jgi:hypothetical protein
MDLKANVDNLQESSLIFAARTVRLGGQIFIGCNVTVVATKGGRY